MASGQTGLSPRVRGNLCQAIAKTDGRRSIPARAGEPYVGCRKLTYRRVYPRACGGTSLKNDTLTHGLGLSPRVRGNLAQTDYGPYRRRSIPARAGEPMRLSRSYSAARVYPRACGGTFRAGKAISSRTGLSPRVRGNHFRNRDGSLSHRSIPARAGEPPTGTGRSARSTVYPRACGGTPK